MTRAGDRPGELGLVQCAENGETTLGWQQKTQNSAWEEPCKPRSPEELCFGAGG